MTFVYHKVCSPYLQEQMMSLEQILNFIEISPLLGTAGQPKRNQFVDIAAAGYQCVINLATSSSENAIADESDLVTDLGMEYIHIPVVWKAPQSADFDLFCTTMDRLKEQRVFVHCELNMRVSAFVYLLRVLKQGANPDEVKWDMLQIWEPEGVWQEFIAKQLGDGQDS
jgi:protein tyrosine phosphatase (PTP) superfamily phosphohydrolase (DUF442 family)